MFLNLFKSLRNARVPVTIREYLTLIECLNKEIISYDIQEFYFLSRASLIKSEKYIDRFDQIFSEVFQGIERLTLSEIIERVELPADWLKKMTEKIMSEEEMKKVNSMGGFEKLMETLKKRLSEQEKRHQGGSKWIGTAGTSPFGSYGYNPEGIRIGQSESRHQRAVKVWDKREFKNFDDKQELGTRSMKIALKRLRQWARYGLNDELDLDETIRATAKNGFLDVKTRPEKKNIVKVLLFLDVGGSMDPYIRKVEELFSAARNAFKRLEYFYFHNCLYEGVWKDNSRRWSEQVSTKEIFNKYGKDYKCIFVGDASMSPYEIIVPGGSNEHFNKETGKVWLERAINQWPSNIWINPIPRNQWQYTQSIHMIRQIFLDRMMPLTLSGLDKGMKELS